MPIYEYRCNRCHHEFDELARSMTEPVDPECPECGGAKVSRRHSVFAAHRAAEQACRVPAGVCGRSACAGGECPMLM